MRIISYQCNKFNKRDANLQKSNNEVNIHTVYTDQCANFNKSGT